MSDQNDPGTRKSSRDYWHLSHLQQLSPSRFSTVVGRILSGRYGLIGSTENRRVILPPAAHDGR